MTAPSITDFILARCDWERMGYPSARDMRQCDAIRAIVGEHQLVPENYGKDPRYGYVFDEGCTICHSRDALIYPLGPCETLMHLAAIWADHKDYQQEWAA